MGKSKQKQRNQNKVENVKIDALTTLDDERITKIIVNALIEYDRVKEEKELNRKEEEQNEFYRTVGYKNFEEIDNKFKRRIAILLNRIVVFFKIMTMSKKRIKGIRTSIALLRIIPYRLLKFVSVFLFLAAVCAFGFIPLQIVFSILPQWETYQYFIVFLISFILYVLSQILRIAYIEIDMTEDQNFIFGTFTAVTTIISIIIAVIALVA